MMKKKKKKKKKRRREKFDFVYLFNGISPLYGLSNAKI